MTVEPKAYGTRAEHLAWAKQRALEYVNAGDNRGAVASMASDLLKHSGFDTAMVATLSMVGAMDVGSAERTRRWVEGFN